MIAVAEQKAASRQATIAMKWTKEEGIVIQDVVVEGLSENVTQATRAQKKMGNK